MWIYVQRTGEFHHDGGPLLATGYSGFGPAKDDPLAQHLPGLGPIPAGAYTICSEREDSTCGPVVMPLIPLPGTQTYGRSAFEIHGDSKEHPGAASHGCIILPRPAREIVSDSPDRLLVVRSGTEIA